MNTYNLTLSPSDRKILESKLLDEINNGQDNFVIDEIDRNSSILTFYTNNTLDSDAITEINQYIIDHIPEWDLPVLMQPTTGGEVTADNPLVTANDPIFNTIPHNHSDLNMDDGPNPHGITKSDLSLENVDNTSDADKPISSATQTALNGKINTSLIGAASGVASLGTDGKVPVGQLPTTSYYVQNTITSRTTSSTYQTYLTFTPNGSFPSGDYLIIANGQYSTSTSLSKIAIALFTDSTELTDTTIQAGYFQTAAVNRLPYHMMTKLSLTSANTVSIRFLSNATNNTATLYTGKIYLQKL